MRKRDLVREHFLRGCSVAALVIGFTGNIAEAQQVVANGTTQTATGTINTGAAGPPAGYPLYALNSGIILSSSPLTLVSGGVNADGAHAESGGNITISSGSSIQTSGSGAPAIHSSGIGSIIIASDTSIQTTGPGGSFGLFAETSGTVILNGGSISSQASSFRANGGGTVNATNVTATANGPNAIGALANNGTINLTGGSVTALNGSASDGLVASLAGGRLTADGVTVNASGNGLRTNSSSFLSFVNGSVTSAGFGANAQSNSTMTIADSTIASTGTGIRADNSTITATNVNVTTPAHGALANGTSANVTLSGGTFGINGSGSGLVAIGGTLDATGINVVGSGASNGHGAIAEAGGTVRLHTGTSISTGGGFNAVGLGASGAGSTLFADAPVLLTTNGRGATGVYMHDSGLVSLVPGSSMTLNGTSSIGVAVDNTAVALGAIGSGLTINLNGTANPAQAASTGVVAFNNGSIALQNVTVTGPNAAAGAWAAPGGTITISGNSRIDINAAQNQTYYTLATATLVNADPAVGSIFSVSGGSPLAGLYAPGGRINSIGTTINVTSGGATGAEASNGGVVDMTSNTITTTGANSSGIRVDSNGQVFGRDSLVMTSGGGAALLINSAPGLIDLTNSTVLATGSNTMGLRTLNFSVAGMSTVNISGGSLVSQQSAGIAAQGPLNFNATNGAVVTGGGGFLLGALNNVAGFQQTVVQLNASGGSSLNGDAFAQSSSIANIGLSTQSRWTGAAFDVTNVDVGPTSTWNVTASSNVTQQTSNGGTIQFTVPGGDPMQLSSYKTLTTRNYVGTGGTLGLNTLLGTDGSPSDRLVIDAGSATGNSLLRIVNTVGGGALTTSNGILVIDTVNGGSTSPGTFALAGPVVAGPYEYTLFRSSVDGSNAQAWYLRSTLNCTVAPVAPECDVPVPPGPSPGPTPNPRPNYRIETSLYAALPSMALLYGRNVLDTLHERVGEEEDGRFRLDSENGKVGWGRIIGVGGVQQGDSLGVLGGAGGPRYSYGFVGLQAGMDVYRHDKPDGSRDQAGAYFAIGGDRGRVTHFDRRQGDSNFAAYTLGGYWTHFGPTGWYTDAILQGTFYEMSATANRGLTPMRTGGQGAAASLEAGRPFKFGDGWFIEPQAQLVYQNVHINDSSDIAAQIRFSDVTSLAGRVGARFGRTWAVDDMSAKTITAWIRPNLWNEFLGNPTTSFSSETGFIPFQASLGGLWGELNAGVSGMVTSNATLFVNVSYQSRFDGGGYAYTGKAGMRLNW